MPSLFARHRTSRSIDANSKGNPGSPVSPTSTTGTNSSPRKVSFSQSGNNADLSGSNQNSGLLGTLKAKLNASKVSLFEDDDPNTGTKRTSRRFSIGQVLAPGSTPGSNGFNPEARRNSIAVSPTSNGRLMGDSPRSFPPGTTIASSPGLDQVDENARRRSVDLISTTESPPRRAGSTPFQRDSQSGVRRELDTAWKPLVPDNKGIPTNTLPPTSPARSPLTSPSVNSRPLLQSPLSTSPTATSPIASTSIPAASPPMNRTTRVPPGRIAMPPPGLVSRQSTASHGKGLSIVPSTPLPRPIANLPTLNGSTTGEPRSGDSTPGYGFPGSGAAQASGSRPGSSSASLHGSPGVIMNGGRSASDARWAKKAMPVMLREPSHRPVPVVTTAEDGSDGSDSQESSESESGSDDDDDSSEEGPARTSLGEVDQRGLLGNRERVDSISEDPEEDTPASPIANRRNLSPLSIPDRRQVTIPTLKDLPESLIAANTSSPTPAQPSSSSWTLPTPKTPGANSFFAGGGGWTQFGGATPTSGTPLGSPSSKRPALGAFALSHGVAKAAALARGQTPAAVSSPVYQVETSYFDSARMASEGNLTPTPNSARPQDDSEEAEELRTPRADEQEFRQAEAEPSSALSAAPLPLDLSNLPGINGSTDTSSRLTTSGQLPASQAMEADRAEASRPSTPRSTRPSMLKHRSRSMVNLSAAASPSLREQDSVAEDPIISEEAPRTSHEANERTAILPVEMVPVGESLKHEDPSPAPSARSSADWARPPPTPGIGMTQPFKFGASSGSGTSTPISSPTRALIQRQMSEARASPIRRRRSLDDQRVKPPQYEPPEPGSRIPGPREEEGRENLPEYWCHVHIEGYLPRKMEFSAPGIQARDRSWKRLYFVLHGTSLRVFKHDVHKIPLRDVSIPEISEAELINLHVHKPGERRDSVSAVPPGARPPAGAAAGARRGSIVEGSVGGSMGRRGSLPGDPDAIGPAARRTSQGSINSSIANTATTTSSEKEMSLFMPPSQAAQARRGSVSVPPPAPSSGINARENIAVHLPFGGGNSLVKQYSLQNAESGLAADYVKKRNVVRVRAEGEQFLLQTDGAKDVVDWIEAFQAATNVSLELDTRPMPKIITLPRRRRRRRPGDPAAAVASAQPGVAGNDDTPEGNARAVEQAERAAQAAAARESGSRNVNAMEAMLAEDQAAA